MSAPHIGIVDAIFNKKRWVFKNLAENFAKTVGSNYSSTLFYLYM